MLYINCISDPNECHNVVKKRIIFVVLTERRKNLVIVIFFIQSYSILLGIKNKFLSGAKFELLPLISFAVSWGVLPMSASLTLFNCLSLIVEGSSRLFSNSRDNTIVEPMLIWTFIYILLAKYLVDISKKFPFFRYHFQLIVGVSI